MERNTRTTVGKLAIGDRFYKVNDKNRTVLQKIEHAPFQTKHYKYTNWAIADGDRHADKMKHDTEVIFLRNVND